MVSFEDREKRSSEFREGEGNGSRREENLERAFYDLGLDVEELACEVLPELRSQFGNPEGVECKQDGSVVTAWDRKMEVRFRDLISKHFPRETVFIGEETEEDTPTDISELDQAQLVTLCDPIDGTSHFVSGEFWYGCSLGIYERDSDGQFYPRFGAVLSPQEGKVYRTEGAGVLEVDLESGARIPLVSPDESSSARPKLVTYPSQHHMLLPLHAPNPHYQAVRGNNASMCDVLSVLRGENQGALIQGKWWDVAAVFAMADKLGIGVYPISEDDSRTWITSDDLVLDRTVGRWQVERMRLVCPKHHFLQLRSAYRKW
jgi:fructose-1,6-bisphosphatase/inositol monophosphatase family enzyme